MVAGSEINCSAFELLKQIKADIEVPAGVEEISGNDNKVRVFLIHQFHDPLMMSSEGTAVKIRKNTDFCFCVYFFRPDFIFPQINLIGKPGNKQDCRYQKYNPP